MKLREQIYKQTWLTALLLMSLSAHAETTVEQELALLKKQLKLLQNKIVSLESQISTSSKNNASKPKAPAEAASNSIAAPAKKEIKLYATVRPTFGYIEENDESLADIRDALSHAGFKATTEFQEGWQAILHGEWGIDLANNGDFGKSRQVYVAVDSPYGRFGIGKQRPVQYLYLAEYVDIFNHSSSPFAYDPESLFFVNNLLTYQKQFGNYTFMAVGQFNGDDGDNYQDLFNTGLSYDNQDLHLALTYTTQDALNSGLEIGSDDIIGASFAYQLNSQLYFAFAYQDKDYQRSVLADRSGHTFDASLAYQFHQNYKLKLGVFDFDDGFNNNNSYSFNGVNATLEWLPMDNLRFHLEYLTRDFDYQHDFTSVSIGFRYDYAQLWTIE